MPSNPTDLPNLSLSDRYAVEAEVGRGGMSTVYAARDLKLDRRVAIKVLRPELAAELGADRFLEEIRITAKLQHPHILSLIDAGRTDGLLYYVMPFVEGESLRERLRRDKRLPLPVTLEIIVEVAGALDYAHRHGIVHRDIKPENILLHEGGAVVADFGVALALRAAEAGHRLTQAGFGIGTPDYMSPEQAAGDPNLDGRSDVYSLGCVFFEMLTGRPPFSATTSQAALVRRAVSGIPSMARLEPSLPPDLDRPLKRALAPAPQDRYETAGEFSRALAEAAGLAVAGTISGFRPAGDVRRGPLTRRVVLAVLAVLALVAVAGGWLLFRGRGSGARPSVRRVAVLPFAMRGCDRLQYLGVGIVDLLSRTMDGVGGIRMVDPQAIQTLPGAGAPGSWSPQQGRAIASRFSAGPFVLGSIVGLGDECRITATIYETSGEERQVPEITIRDESTVASAIDELTRQLLLELVGESIVGRLDMATLTTESLPALKAYLNAQAELRSGHLEAAADGFRQAVTIDSTFALAWYRLWVATDWAEGHFGTGVTQRDQIERALRHSGRLPERARRLLQAFAAYERGDAEVAEAMCVEILASYPNDVEAWYVLGETLIHGNTVRGRSVLEAREPFERVLRLQPNHAFALYHLAELAARQGDYAGIDSLTRRFLELESPSTTYTLRLRALRAFAVGGTGAQGALMDELQRALPQLTVSAPALVLLLPRLSDAELMLRALTDLSYQSQVRGFGFLGLAYTALAGGRRGAAQAALARAEAIDPRHAVVDRALMAVVPFFDSSSAELATARRVIEEQDSIQAMPEQFLSRRLHGDELLPHITPYALGVLSARMGDPQAERYAERLDALPRPPGSGPVIGDLVRGIRAEALRTDGRITEAVALIDRPMRAWSEPMQEPWSSRPNERFLRAELSRAAGRFEAAARWYATFEAVSLLDLAYVAQAQLRLGELFEARGDRDAARRHYQRFLDLWADADGEFQPMVRDVRRRISRLEAAASEQE